MAKRKVHWGGCANGLHRTACERSCGIFVGAMLKVTPSWWLVTCKRCLARKPKRAKGK